MGWYYPTGTLPTGSNYKTFYSFSSTNFVYQVFFGQVASGKAECYIATNTTTSDLLSTAAMTTDVWVGFAAVYSATAQTVTCYIRSGNHGLLTRVGIATGINFSAATFGLELIGTDETAFSTTNLAAGYHRSWQRALTTDELKVEFRKESASLQTNLFMDTPLRSTHNLIDESDVYSGGHNWTLIPNG